MKSVVLINFHLARFDGKWLIVNVIWQSPPKAAAQN